MKTLALSLALLPLAAFAADPALTIYNQDFAVVRETVPLDLKEGVNTVAFSGISALLEPDSVILRDPSGKTQLQILEQNFRNDPVSQAMMLSLFEGKVIEFLVREPQKADRVVTGKIIRSGYVPGQNGADADSQPIIEVEGKLQFELPGMPVFPAIGDQSILKPQLGWELNASAAGKLDAELCYVSGGMSWSADYNLVASEKGDLVDLVGWVTMNNRTGKTFDNAKVKLMAGDVNKIQDVVSRSRTTLAKFEAMAGAAQPPVTEKSFDEFHLYTLQRPVTLHDKETKQVEFVRATGVKATRLYVYDGAELGGYGGLSSIPIGGNPDFGTQSNSKVSVMREFKNSKENNLGMPLPKGRLRFYLRDDDGQLEFIGENEIDHTPKDEKIRVYVGNAFDIKGERKRVDFRVNEDGHWADEAFEIKLRNHKTEPVTVNVVEHLYRWVNWEIQKPSVPFTKKDSQTIEFPVELKPDEEKTITYLVHYTW
jgi:hypothetical protein